MTRSLATRAQIYQMGRRRRSSPNNSNRPTLPQGNRFAPLFGEIEESDNRDGLLEMPFAALTAGRVRIQVQVPATKPSVEERICRLARFGLWLMKENVEMLMEL